jgi:hypothetical protein
VTGNIGMGELIRQFLQINDAVTLAKPDKEKKDKKIFSDKLVFTTLLKGGVKPSLVLSPSTGHTVRFNGDFNADRKDVHEVIVDILPGSPPAEPAGEPEPKPTLSKVEIGKMPDKMPDMRILLIPSDDDKKAPGSAGSVQRSAPE